nr:MAG TPA: ATPase [Caudoviricetes sp.]
MANFKFLVNDKDITNYITSFTWSGDNNEAARKHHG